LGGGEKKGGGGGKGRGCFCSAIWGDKEKGRKKGRRRERKGGKRTRKEGYYIFPPIRWQ